MSNDTRISVSRDGSQMGQNLAYMQHLHITQDSYVLFLLFLVRYMYDGLIHRRNSNVVEFVARNTVVLLFFVAHIGKT